jgi:hypothetical protein
MKGKFLIPLVTLAIPALVLAQDTGKYRCTHGDLVRRVEIFTEPGVSVPCEVHYYKDTEAPGETQVLWSAEADGGYCVSQTQAFITKLEGWGWSCGAGAESAPAPEAAPSAPAPEAEPEEEAPVQDDTDVLSPGDPSGS